MTGLFISFEGIDGAGKSSHIQALAQAFRAQALAPEGDAQDGASPEVLLTREPGGTALSERLRELILHEPMDLRTEALLVFAARREHIVQVIAPALARGDVVLCDRFTDSSFAYQGAGRGLDLEALSALEQFVQDLSTRDAQLACNTPIDPGLLQPHLTLLFDVPPEIAAQRLRSARPPDKFEAQDLGFFQRVTQGYAARVAADPQRFVRINGHQNPHAVRAEVMAAVRAKQLLPAAPRGSMLG